MKQIKKFEFPVSASKSSHDWKAIFAAEVAVDNLGKPGAAVVLESGSDFTGKPENFANTIRSRAYEHHLHSKVVVVDSDKPLIYVQVAKMTDEEAAEADVKIAANKERNKASSLKRAAAKKAGTTDSSVAGTIPESKVG